MGIVKGARGGGLGIKRETEWKEEKHRKIIFNSPVFLCVVPLGLSIYSMYSCPYRNGRVGGGVEGS
jgi:hypothetical protein